MQVEVFVGGDQPHQQSGRRVLPQPGQLVVQRLYRRPGHGPQEPARQEAGDVIVDEAVQGVGDGGVHRTRYVGLQTLLLVGHRGHVGPQNVHGPFLRIRLRQRFLVIRDRLLELRRCGGVVASYQVVKHRRQLGEHQAVPFRQLARHIPGHIVCQPTQLAEMEVVGQAQPPGPAPPPVQSVPLLGQDPIVFYTPAQQARKFLAPDHPASALRRPHREKSPGGVGSQSPR